MTRDFVKFCQLVILSLLIGFSINPLRQKPLPLFYQPKERSPKNAEITLEEFRKFVEQKQGIVLDARLEIHHRFGHIPGAFSLPNQDFAESFKQLQNMLERDRSQKIVVYCTGFSCDDSEAVRQKLLKLGFTNVKVFHGGWAEWKQRNLPQEPRP